MKRIKVYNAIRETLQQIKFGSIKWELYKMKYSNHILNKVDIID